MLYIKHKIILLRLLYYTHYDKPNIIHQIYEPYLYILCKNAYRLLKYDNR